MPNRDTIVIGASAGGVQALLALVADVHPNLHADFYSPSRSLRRLRIAEQEMESDELIASVEKLGRISKLVNGWDNYRGQSRSKSACNMP